MTTIYQQQTRLPPEALPKMRFNYLGRFEYILTNSALLLTASQSMRVFPSLLHTSATYHGCCDGQQNRDAHCNLMGTGTKRRHPHWSESKPEDQIHVYSSMWTHWHTGCALLLLLGSHPGSIFLLIGNTTALRRWRWEECTDKYCSFIPHAYYYSLWVFRQYRATALISPSLTLNIRVLRSTNAKAGENTLGWSHTSADGATSVFPSNSSSHLTRKSQKIGAFNPNCGDWGARVWRCPEIIPMSARWRHKACGCSSRGVEAAYSTSSKDFAMFWPPRFSNVGGDAARKYDFWKRDARKCVVYLQSPVSKPIPTPHPRLQSHSHASRCCTAFPAVSKPLKCWNRTSII